MTGHPVEVEVRLSSMLPRIDLVGLPETAVRESAARVRAAIHALGLSFPDRRVTVNLAPASLPKGGAGLDLPIAIGILAAMGAVPAESLGSMAFVGELALDGRLRPVPGALPMARALARAGGGPAVFAAAAAGEASFAPGLTVLGAEHLSEVAAHLVRGSGLAPEAAPPFAPERDAGADLVDVRGQERAKRALVIAAAGGHGLFLSGPPGSGKTMLARRLPGLLPAPSLEEALEITEIHSAARALPDPTRAGSASPLRSARPFRAPHHSASRAGLLGGGVPATPGEVSLAHRGVLFLDEFPEFDRGVREALRQVIEERRVTVARARSHSTFPAHFQLVLAANPCPCGWLGSRWRSCSCDDNARRRYRARLSGPLLDRVDLYAALPAVDWRALDDASGAAGTRDLRAQVDAARERADARLGGLGLRANADLPDRWLERGIDATAAARDLLGRATEGLRLSARGARRALRVARTIADLRGETRTGSEAIAEALSYRSEDTNG